MTDLATGPTLLAAFDIVGLPHPQGSKTVMGGHVVEGGSTTGRQKHRTWRQAVVETCREHAPATPYDGHLELLVTFRLPCPASRNKAARLAAERDGHPSIVKPDLDKLLRGLLDGMTQAGLIRDDACIADFDRIRKREFIGWTGASLRLYGWSA